MSADALIWNSTTPPSHTIHYIRKCIFHLYIREIHLIDKSILYRFKSAGAVGVFISVVSHQSFFCCTFFQASKAESTDTGRFQSPVISANGKKKEERRKKKEKRRGSLNPQVRLVKLPFFGETLTKGAQKDSSLLLTNFEGNERLFQSHLRAVREFHGGPESAESRVQKQSEVGRRQEQKPEGLSMIVILVPCDHRCRAKEERDKLPG